MRLLEKGNVFDSDSTEIHTPHQKTVFLMGLSDDLSTFTVLRAHLVCFLPTHKCTNCN